MRIIVLILMLAFAPRLVASQESYKFHEALPLNLSSGERGYAKLSLDDGKLRRGERYVVEYTFHNTNGSYWVYNCFFNRLIPLPGQLAIYDSNKEYLGDLLRFEGGSQKGVGDGDWLFLYGGSHVGMKLEFRAGYVPLTKYGSMGNLLPPGRYYIQLILYQAFLSTNPSRLRGDKPDFYKTFDRSAVIRSNAIQIEVVD
jgi:hypothetical protein